MTLNQYYLILAHNAVLDEKIAKKDGTLTKEESEKLWNEQMLKANERVAQRKKTKEQQIKEAQDKIIKKIEENKK